jgi:hypothetical protein
MVNPNRAIAVPAPQQRFEEFRAATKQDVSFRHPGIAQTNTGPMSRQCMHLSHLPNRGHSDERFSFTAKRQPGMGIEP